MSANEPSTRPSLYEALARWVLHHQPAVAAFAVLTSIVSVLVGIPPDIDSNLINLLPEREPAVAAIRRLNDEGVGINFLTLSFGSEDPEALDAWLDDLVVELEARDDVVLAMHELEDDLARQVALLQFEADEVAELNHRLMGAMALGSAMNPVVAQQVLDMGPLAERMAEHGELHVGDGALVDAGGRGKALAGAQHRRRIDRPFAAIDGELLRPARRRGAGLGSPPRRLHIQLGRALHLRSAPPEEGAPPAAGPLFHHSSIPHGRCRQECR